MATATRYSWRIPALGGGEHGTRECVLEQTLAQLGKMTIMAISGLRFLQHPDGVTLPVGEGYAVRIALGGNDEYIVQRLYRGEVAGERTGIYAEELSETAYAASCFNNGEW